MEMPFRFNPRRRGLVQVFGPLEAEIMREVWKQGETTVKQVHRVLSRRREIAYTTVMTTMSRLAQKGVLERLRQGMAYLYRPVMSREEFEQWVLRSVLAGLFENYEQAAADSLVEYLAREQPEQLAYLRQVLSSQAAA